MNRLSSPPKDADIFQIKDSSGFDLGRAILQPEGNPAKVIVMRTKSFDREELGMDLLHLADYDWQLAERLADISHGNPREVAWLFDHIDNSHENGVKIEAVIETITDFIQLHFPDQNSPQ